MLIQRQSVSALMSLITVFTDTRLSFFHAQGIIMKKIIAFFAIVAAVIAAVFGILLWRARSQASAAISAYNAAAEEYNGKITPYNEAAAQTGAENDRLQGVIDAAQSLLDKDAGAYEPKTKKDLQKAVDKASKVFVEVPVQIDPFQPQTLVNSFRRADMDVQQIEAQAAEAAVEKAMETIPEVPEVPDYTEQVEAVEKAQKAYTDSVQMLTNVTAPPDTFVKDRLAKIDTVVQAQAVTKDNDPNGLLGKEDGYTGCVYFLDDRIDRSLLPQEAFEKEQEKKKDKDSDNEKDKGSDNEKEKDKEIEKKKAETEAEESKNASTTASTASSTAVDGDPASTAASTASATAADGDTASLLTEIPHQPHPQQPRPGKLQHRRNRPLSLNPPVPPSTSSCWAPTAAARSRSSPRKSRQKPARSAWPFLQAVSWTQVRSPSRAPASSAPPITWTVRTRTN